MRTSSMRVFTVIGLLAFSYPYAVSCVEAADNGALRDHFEGKTVRILHGSSPGGGYDLIARALARLLPDYLPGKPRRIIVQPRPGGGPFRLNSLKPLVDAKPDGLTIGYAYAPWVVAETIGKGQQGLKLEDVKPLGTPIGGYTDNVYCTSPKLATSWEDIEKLGRPILWGGIAPGLGGHLIAAPWLKELGAPIKLVWGYGGTAEMGAAFRRGEVELASSCAGTLVRDYSDWAKEGNLAPIFWIGRVTPLGEQNLKTMGLKRPRHIYEVAKKYIAADWQKDAFEAGLNLGRLSYSYFIPAGVPEEVYAVWRDVFRKIVDDPRFAKALHPNYRERLAPMYGEEMEKTLKTVKGLSAKALSLLKILVEGH